MTKFFLFILFIAGSLAAHAGNPGDPKLYNVKVDESIVAWTARKVTGVHNGTVAIKEGSLNMKDGALTGGSFIMDMTTITNLDQKGEGKTKLEGHLKSDDFFGVATFPTASLVIKKVNFKGDLVYTITAELTIKGITNPVTFDALVTKQGNQVNASADIKVDRTLYDIRYGSNKFFEGLGDKAIYDEFDLNIKLVAVGK